jgi:hypothetical protein
MRNRDRSLVVSVGRASLLVVGIIGAFAAVDATLLFVYFLLAAILIEAPGPYAGLLMLVALPGVAAIGAVVAWTAYAVLHDASSPRDERRVAHT